MDKIKKGAFVVAAGVEMYFMCVRVCVFVYAHSPPFLPVPALMLAIGLMDPYVWNMCII